MTNTIIPLGELVNIQTGKLDANASSEDGAYPFFTCAREPLQISDWKYDLDAVLIAGNGDLNVKHYVGKFDAYQRTYILDAKDTDVLDTRFLFHFLDKYVERLREQSIGGIIKYIKLGMLTEAQIPLPPLDEQKRIAGILDQADALRRLRTRALDKLNSLGQAIFHEMFGDGVGQDVELRRLGRVQTGSTPSTKHPEFFDGKIPFVTPGDLDSDRPFTRFVSEEGARKSRTVAEGATFVCCIGATIGKMGVAKSRSAFNQQINSVEWGEAVLPAFGFFAMQMIRSEIIHIGKGAATTLPILKKSLFEKMKVRVVPLEQQREFISRYELAMAMTTHLEKSDTHLESLFASLQHRAFRGEL